MAKFNIRRLDKEAQPAPNPPAPPPVSPSSGPAEPQIPAATEPESCAPTVASVHTGARFASLQRLLGYLGTLSGLGLANAASCRHAPDRSQWWAQIDQVSQPAIALARSAGGQAYLGSGRRWLPAPQGMAEVSPPNASVFDLQDWPELDLHQLLGQMPLSPATYRCQPQVYVCTIGTLARWVMGRASNCGLQVTVQLAQLQQGDLAPQPRLFLRLQGQRSFVPSALVSRLTALPYTQVYSGGPKHPFYVSVNRRLALTNSFLADLLPQGETWLFGTDGAARLQLQGNSSDAHDLLSLPAALIPAPSSAQGATLAKAPAVRLVACGGQRKIDALLLDDFQLSRLGLLLRHQAAAASAFLLPGNGRHLLLASSQLLAQIPLGSLLCHQGPGALYLECGQQFHPPLPDQARTHLFQLDGKRAVVVTQAGSWSFALERLLPAWTLWASAPSPALQGLSAQGERLLRALDLQLGEAEQRRTRSLALKEYPELQQPQDRQSLRLKALEARQAGDLLRAAQLLEQAGDHGEAAQLYEKTAGASGKLQDATSGKIQDATSGKIQDARFK